MRGILEFHRASFRYPGTFEIRGLDWTVPAGSFTLVLGPNGAGKTTLFRLALGLLKPLSGAVYLKGRETAKSAPREIARTAAMVEQETHYAFPYTVSEVVAMGRFPYSGGRFWDAPEDLAAVKAAVEAAGLQGFEDRPVQSLSGGERRRVEIARALCQEPELLLLDEPAAFLDLRQQAELMTLLGKLNREKGLTILMVSHQPGLARAAATHAVFMSRGEILERGPGRDLLRPDILARLFELPPGTQDML